MEWRWVARPYVEYFVLRCPKCRSKNHTRKGQRKILVEGGVLRTHWCRDCKELFISREAIKDGFETAE